MAPNVLLASAPSAQLRTLGKTALPFLTLPVLTTHVA